MVDCHSRPSGRVCDGCADTAELQGANSNPVSGLPCGAEWQGHGGDCPDWLWKDTGCKDVWPSLFILQNFKKYSLQSREYRNEAAVIYLFIFFLQYLLPAIVHINHQPYLERGDGPIVSANFLHVSISDITLNISLI